MADIDCVEGLFEPLDERVFELTERLELGGVAHAILAWLRESHPDLQTGRVARQRCIRSSGEVDQERGWRAIDHGEVDVEIGFPTGHVWPA